MLETGSCQYTPQTEPDETYAPYRLVTVSHIEINLRRNLFAQKLYVLTRVLLYRVDGKNLQLRTDMLKIVLQLL